LLNLDKNTTRADAYLAVQPGSLPLVAPEG
jgi:hypothetical protein